MGLLNYTTRANLVANTPENIADVTDCLDKIRTSVNSIDAEQFSSSLAPQVGANDSGNTRRGKCIIATTESRTDTSYGLLTTPDRVQNIVLPTDGLLFIAYQATWQWSATNAGRAAIFLNSDQLKVASSNPAAGAAAVTQAAAGTATTATDAPLATGATGLVSGTSNPGYSGDVTTGQILGFQGGASVLNWSKQELNGASPFLSPDASMVPAGVGGPVVVFASAGTYTVSVQFKSASGSVTVKNRKLWVWTQGF